MPTFDPDGFEADLAAPEKSGKMAIILAAMDPDDARVVESALRDLSIPATRLAKALTNQGYKTGATPVETWRAKHVPS
jgi:hypothetical protein